ncbi:MULTISPECIES: YeiH family protein [Halomonas]|uniref:YeiH family protein n=1 Tax=Halomonas TaxID=2745 RepID=UPI001C97A67F|nr:MULTISPECIES: putative sulfate exporter family transporter [Halomonas]MBY6206700.1 putative sulfate exporter family transporter [Halomonas sp. DP3Y7-2]MBY6230231.1 putative sulfate exporter family transporter [Halomonas sp. DP3Y7-1]MCA0918361.1 putative sulfate exporter family transporter [Halomonas denitrificans]
MTSSSSSTCGVAPWRRLTRRLSSLSPVGRGLLVCVTIALATTFIADHYGGPTLLYALLFGMSLHFLSEEGRCLPGIEFAARTVLRLGVALLGARMTLEQVGDLGLGPVLTVLAAVGLVICAGGLLARALGLQRDLGLLTGGAVAICGASAALALSAVMPKNETSERNTILTVVGVTTLSTMAMVTYPLLVGVLDLANTQAGIFLGGTIHDVAQVVGAGYIISDETGDVSTLVKLVRVAMLVPVVMVFSWLYRASRKDQGEGKRRVPMLPGFLVGFVALVLVNSLGLIPGSVNDGLSALSRWCLVTAIAALGIKTSFQKLAVVGWEPVILMVLETLLLLAIVLGVVVFGGLGS